MGVKLPRHFSRPSSVRHVLTVVIPMDTQSQALAGLHQATMTALRAEHPDWTDEVFNDYETRFAELLRQLLGHPKRQHPKSIAQTA